MLVVRITGNQLRAGRALADLSMEDLAARARLSRRTLSKWEGSSDATPSAMTDHLCRALDVLESEGIRFSDGGATAAQHRSRARLFIRRLQHDHRRSAYLGKA